MNRERKRKILGLIFGIIFYVFLISSLTFAYYSWTSDHTSVNLKLHDGGIKFVYDDNNRLTGNNLTPILDYTNSNYYTEENNGKYLLFNEYTATNTRDVAYKMYAKLNVKTLSNSLKSNAVKWVLQSKTTQNGTYSIVTNSTGATVTGTFSSLTIGSNTLNVYDNIYVKPGETVYYRFVVYIDSNVNSNISGTIDADLELCDLEVPIFAIALNGSSKIGPSTINYTHNNVYESYAVGIFREFNSSDFTVSKKMLTSGSSDEANPITVPTACGYTFESYKDSGTTLIGSNGYITNNFTNTRYRIGDNSKVPPVAATLTDSWTENTYKINAINNGGSLTFSKSSNVKYHTDVVTTTARKNFLVNVTNSASVTLSSSTATSYQTFDGWTATDLNSCSGDSSAKYGTTSSPSTSWTNGSTKVTGTTNTSTHVTTTYFKQLNSSTSGTVTLTANWTPVDVTLPTASLPGYTCGFTTTNGGTTIEYSNGASYTPSATLGTATLYSVKLPNTVTINVKKDNSAWDSSGVTISLRKSGATYTNSVTSGTSTTFSGVVDGTYNIYFSKDSNNISELVDSGNTITVTTTNSKTAVSVSGTVNYYTLTMNSSNGTITFNGTTGITNGTKIVAASTPNSIHDLVAVPSNGYSFKSWQSSSTSTPITSTTSATTTLKAGAVATITLNTYANNYQNTTTNAYFEKLNEALSAVTSNQTIKVLNGVTETTASTLTSGKTGVTLDLNGNTTTLSNVVLNNSGALTITGNGSLSGTGASVIDNGTGTLTVSGGTISGTKHGISTTTGVINVNGGTVKSTATSGNYDGIYKNGATGTITISSGTVTGYRSGIYNNLSGPISITGGLVSGRAGITNAASGAITINGTNAKVEGTSGVGITGLTGTVTVTNGTVTGTTHGISSTTGVVKVNGGYVASTAASGNYDGIYKNGTSGSISVSSGTVIGYRSGIYNDNTSSVSISGGEISGTTQGIYNKSTGAINITDGTITGNAGIVNAGAGVVTINGATAKVQGVSGNGITGVTGTITVTKGTVTGSASGITSTTGAVTVNGGYVASTADTGNFDGINKNGATGTVTISSGTVVGYRAGIYNGGVSPVSITGGSVTGTTQGIYNNTTGSISVTGGTVTGNAGIVNKAAGIITINSTTAKVQGTNGNGITGVSGSVTLTNGTVIGSTQGIAITTGTVTISNGTVTGSTYGISATTGVINVNGGKVESTTASGTNAGIYKNGASGTVTVSNGTVTGYYGIYNNVAGPISITGGEVSGTGVNGIYNKTTGAVSVTGGTVSGVSHGIHMVGAGTLTMGENGGTPSTTIPLIKTTGTSSVYGVYIQNASAKYNFYDGKVTSASGTGYSIYTAAGIVIAVPDNYDIVKSTASGTETAILGAANNYQNTATNIKYMYLYRALSAVESSQTIKVLNGITETTAASIASGKTGITLNLNGNTTTLSGINITNNGELTITGNGSLSGTAANVINNGAGTLTVSGGTITGTQTGVTSTTGPVTVSGGAIISTATTGNFDGIYKNGATGAVTITNGIVTGYRAGIYNNAASPITISGGAISGTTQGIYSNSTGEVSITGGTITGNAGIVNKGASPITINATTAKVEGTSGNGITGVTGTITVTKGTVTGSASGITSTTGEVTVNGGYVASTATSGNCDGIYKNGATGEVTLSSGTVIGYRAGIYNNAASPVSITGGSVTGTTQGIYNNTTGSISVTGGTVTGNAGIVNKAAGIITINSTTAKVQGTSGNGITGVSGSVTLTTGSVIGSTQGIAITTGTVTISNGTVTGSTNGISATTGAVNINGGKVESTTASGTNAGIYKNGATGTVTVSNGTVTGYYGIYNNAASPIIVNSGQVSGTGVNGIYNKTTGAVSLTGGTVSGVSHGIHMVAAGTLTMGENGGTPSITIPLVKTTGTSDKYGVYIQNASGVYNFYDGKVTSASGTWKSIVANGTINTPDGYWISRTTTSNTETAILGPKYTVKFTTGNAACNVNISNITTAYPSDFVNQNAITLPTCTGYIFTGWTASGDINTTTAKYGTTTTSLNNWTNGNKGTYFKDLSTVTNGTVTLTAGWDQVHWYIGSNYYTTLANAVSAASAGDTIYAYDSHTDSSTVTISKNLTINTNGKVVTRTLTTTISSGSTVTLAGTGTLTTSSAVTLITNNGVLNVTHTGLISNTNTGNYRTITNNSTGTVNKTGTGTITSNVGYDTIGGTGLINIINGLVSKTTAGNAIYSNGGTITISGGTISTEAARSIYVEGSGTTTISGGIIQKSGTLSGAVIQNNGTGTITISKGTITSNTGSNAIYNGSTGVITVSGGLIQNTSTGYGGTNNSTGIINVTGGVIQASANRGLSNTTTGTINITGGTITGTNGILNAASGVITVNGTAAKVQGTSGIGITGLTGKVTLAAGTVIGTSSGISASTGTITITGGTVTGTTYGINVTGAGNLTMGTNEGGTPSKTIPLIQATATTNSFGVYIGNNSATYNFYDGKVTSASGEGKSISYGGTINTPDGYGVSKTTTSGVETAVLDRMYTITLKAGTGISTLTASGWTGSPGTTLTKSILINSKITLSDITTTNSTGYSGSNWAKTSGNGTLANGTFTVGSSDATLTVTGNINSYLITLIAGEGVTKLTATGWTGTPGATLTRSLSYETSLPMSNIAVTLDTGYHGSTWSKTNGSGTLSNGTFTVGAGTATLTVKSSPNTYTTKFATGNTSCTISIADKTATYNESVSSTAINNPTCTGYTFTGWTLSGDKNTSTAKYGTTSSPTEAWVDGNKGTYFINLSTTNGGTVTLTAGWMANNYQNTTTNAYFEKLSDALNAVASNQTIKVLNGVTETTAATLTSGKTGVTLDLNGKTTTLSNVVLNNSGALTITGNGTISGTGASVIDNGTGTLTVSGGTISGTKHGISTTTGVINVNGGTVKSTATTGNYDGIYKNGATGTVTVSSGTVTGYRSAIYNNLSSPISITGGLVSGRAGIVNVASGAITVNGTNAKVEGTAGIGITGLTGTVTVTKGTVTGTAMGITSTTGVVTVNGGYVASTATSGNNDGINKNGTTGTVSISSGTVIGYRSGIYNNSTSPVSISGGSVSGTTQAIYNGSTGNVGISAGQITGTTQGIYNNGAGTINITGGTVTGNAGIVNKADGIITINSATAKVQGTSGNGITGVSGSVTLTSGSVVGSTSGINITTGTVIVSSGTVTGAQYGINVTTGVVTVNGGKVESSGTTSTYSGIYKNGASGTVTVSNGTVTGYYGIYNNVAGPISITGGLVSGTGVNGIYNKTTGAVSVTGGTVSGVSHGIHMVGAGTLTMGTNDGGTPSTTIPLIKTTGTSSVYGVYIGNASCVYNFYDGKVTSASGTGYSIYGSIVINVPDNYDIVKSTASGTETAILGAANNYQNTTTNIKYMYLYRALSSVASSQTIKVLNGVTETTAASIASGKTGVTLDLNGKTITLSGVNITNSGELTVTGSSGAISGNVNNLINLGSGTLTVSGGTITGTQTVVNSTTGPITVNGGAIISTATTGNFDGIYKNGATGAITVSSGIVTGYRAGIYNNAASPITISGGAISGTTYGVYNGSTGNVGISGGQITGTTQGLYNNGAGAVSITGGTITGNAGIVNKGACPITINAASAKVQGTSGNGITGVTGTITVTKGTVTGSASGITSTTGEVTVNGGYVASTASSGNNDGIYKNGATGEVTLSSGTVIGYRAGIYNNAASPVSISGGSVSGTTQAIYNGSTGNVGISAGQITGTTQGIYNNGAGTINITGGTVTGNAGIVNKAAGIITINNTTAKVQGTSGNGITGVSGSVTLTSGSVIGSTTGASLTTGTITISTGTITGAQNGIGITTGVINVNGGKVESTTASGTNSGIYKNGASGTVTVSNGTVTGYYGIYNNVAGPISITGGLVSGTGVNGIYNKTTGAVSVTGGTVSGVSHGIHMVGAGTLTMGTNDGGTPSTTIPLIKTTGTSNAYGVNVQNASATYNFYDGKVTSASGTGFSINYTSTINTPNGYYVVKSTTSGTETAILSNVSTITLKVGTGVSTLTASGWTGSPGTTITKSLTYGSTISLSDITITNTTGYSGSTWEKTSGAGTLTGSNFVVGAGPATLTVTGTMNSYTITLKAGKGVSSLTASGWTNSPGATITKSLTYGSTLSLSGITVTNATGYSGSTWSKEGSGTLSGTNFVVGAGAATLTVSGTENSYTITLKAGTGVSTLTASGWTSSPGTTITKSLTYGSTLSLSGITVTNTTGYSGSTWEKTSGAGTLTGSNFVVGTGAATLTVTGTINSYTITLKAGTGVSTLTASGWTSSPGTTITKSLTYGSTLSLSGITVTNATGYSGSTWAKTGGSGTLSGTNFVVGAGVATLTVSGTLTTYTISYADCGGDSFSGIHGSGYPTSYVYGTGATLDTPTKSGYVFGGYYTECPGEGTGTPITSVSTTDTGNKEFLAQWIPNKVTINIFENGANTVTSEYVVSLSTNSTTNTNTFTGTATDSTIEFEEIVSGTNYYIFSSKSSESSSVTYSGVSFTAAANQTQTKSIYYYGLELNRDNTTRITALSNGGVSTPNNEQIFYLYNSSSPQSVSIVATLATGANFSSWTIDTSSGYVSPSIDNSSATVTSATIAAGAMKLTANSTGSTYTITYQGNGASNQPLTNLISKYDGYYNAASGHNSSATSWTDMNATNTGSVNIGSGSWGDKYLSLDGSTTYASLGYMPTTYITQEITFSTNYSGKPSKAQFVLGDWQSGGGGIYISSSDGSISAQSYIGSGFKNVISNVVVEQDKIYHVAYTYDGSMQRIYINGVLSGSNTISGTIGYPASNTYMTIGSDPNGSGIGSNTPTFNGKVYNAAIYNTALTADQVTEDYGKSVKLGETYGTLPTPYRGDGYMFEGWYTSPSGGTKITSSSIVSTASDQTLYAHWSSTTETVNCASTGSNTTFANKSWYTVDNSSDGYCYLALNEVSSSYGAYSSASTSLSSEYSSILGISDVTNLGHYTGTNTISGIYWGNSASNVVVSDSSLKKYTLPTQYNLYYSSRMTNSSQNPRAPYYLEGSTYKTKAPTSQTVTACSSISSNKCVITNGTYTSSSISDGNAHMSYYFSDYHYTDGTTSSQVSLRHVIYTNMTSSMSLAPCNNYGGSSTSGNCTSSNTSGYHTAAKITSALGSAGTLWAASDGDQVWTHKDKQVNLYACGGSRHGSIAYAIKNKSSSTVYHKNYYTDNGWESFSVSGVHEYWVAGYAESTVSSDVRTYRHDTPSWCLARTSLKNYSLADRSENIHYRLYIKVKK